MNYDQILKGIHTEAVNKKEYANKLNNQTRHPSPTPNN